MLDTCYNVWFKFKVHHPPVGTGWGYHFCWKSIRWRPQGGDGYIWWCSPGSGRTYSVMSRGLGCKVMVMSPPRPHRGVGHLKFEPHITVTYIWITLYISHITADIAVHTRLPLFGPENVQICLYWQHIVEMTNFSCLAPIFSLKVSTQGPKSDFLSRIQTLFTLVDTMHEKWDFDGGHMQKYHDSPPYKRYLLNYWGKTKRGFKLLSPSNNLKWMLPYLCKKLWPVLAPFYLCAHAPSMPLSPTWWHHVCQRSPSRLCGDWVIWSQKCALRI